MLHSRHRETQFIHAKRLVAVAPAAESAAATALAAGTEADRAGTGRRDAALSVRARGRQIATVVGVLLPCKAKSDDQRNGGSMLSRTRYLRFMAAVVAVVATALAAPLQAQGAPVTTVVSSGNISTPITDATWVVVGQSFSPGFTTSTLTVPDLGTIVDVNVRLRASHTFVGDLGVFLNAPDDTSVTLATPYPDSGDNFGSGANDCTGTPTILDDAASSAIGSATAPFAGSFRPDEALATLNGKPAAGVWELSFIDLFPGDSGSIYCWELEITYEPPAADLSVTGSDSPDPVRVGKRVKYTIAASNEGPGGATGVSLVDTLPAGATFVSAKTTQGSCSRAARKVTCALGDLASGTTATVTVVVRAPRLPGRLTNTASITADQADPDIGDNRVQLRTRVRK